MTSGLFEPAMPGGAPLEADEDEEQWLYGGGRAGRAAWASHEQGGGGGGSSRTPLPPHPLGCRSLRAQQHGQDEAPDEGDMESIFCRINF
ncbi:UNVERIFIED_CONTAM: hypothetical protein K2H54_048517 [Gekko kuhli]